MVVPMMIPIQSYPQNVKKTDLDSFLQKYAKRARIGFIAGVAGSFFVQAVVGFLVTPKMFGLYNTVKPSAPAYIIPLMLVSAALGLVLLTFITMSNPLDINKVERVRQSKEEMVTINGPLINSKLEFLFWGYIAVFILVLVVTTILPIYRLTSSIP